MTESLPHALACDEMGLMIQADQDGELDAAAVAVLASHLRDCPGCAALARDLAVLGVRLRHTLREEAAPARLRATLEAQLAVRPARKEWRLPRFGVPAFSFAAGVACAAVFALALPGPRMGPNLMAELVSGHVRALQPGHLIDVPSSDRHTVKPWFEGKLDFAPPVADFAAAGFVLEGGRLDVVGGRSVAVLIYRRDKHPINLFVWPEQGGGESAGMRDGFAVRQWQRNGLGFHAVSDIDPAELAAFARLWQAMP